MPQWLKLLQNASSDHSRTYQDTSQLSRQREDEIVRFEGSFCEPHLVTLLSGLSPRIRKMAVSLFLPDVYSKE